MACSNPLRDKHSGPQTWKMSVTKYFNIFLFFGGGGLEGWCVKICEHKICRKICNTNTCETPGNVCFYWTLVWVFQSFVWVTKTRKLNFRTSNHSLSHSVQTYCEAISFLSAGLCTVQYSKFYYGLFVFAPNVMKGKRNFLCSCQLIFFFNTVSAWRVSQELYAGKPVRNIWG